MSIRAVINHQRLSRSRRTRVSLSSGRLRLSVFRSHRYIYAQIIDDAKGHTLVSASSLELKKPAGNKTAQAEAVGTLIAKKAIEKGIKSVSFDRGFYRYHGRLAALAKGARAEGLNF